MTCEGVEIEVRMSKAIAEGLIEAGWTPPPNYHPDALPDEVEVKEPTWSGFTEAQIQRIIDEEFLVLGYDGYVTVYKFHKNSIDPFEMKQSTGRFFRQIELVREVGIRQPWFGGEYDGHPDDVVVYRMGSSEWLMGSSGGRAKDIGWSVVTEYILLEKAQ